MVIAIVIMAYAFAISFNMEDSLSQEDAIAITDVAKITMIDPNSWVYIGILEEFLVGWATDAFVVMISTSTDHRMLVFSKQPYSTYHVLLKLWHSFSYSQKKSYSHPIKLGHCLLEEIFMEIPFLGNDLYLYTKRKCAVSYRYLYS